MIKYLGNLNKRSKNSNFGYYIVIPKLIVNNLDLKKNDDIYIRLKNNNKESFFSTHIQRFKNKSETKFFSIPLRVIDKLEVENFEHISVGLKPINMTGIIIDFICQNCGQKYASKIDDILCPKCNSKRVKLYHEKGGEKQDGNRI